MLMKMMLFLQLLYESSLQKLELDSLHLKFLNVSFQSFNLSLWKLDDCLQQNFGHFEIAFFHQEHVGQFGNQSI